MSLLVDIQVSETLNLFLIATVSVERKKSELSSKRTLASISDVRIALESFGTVAPCPPNIASSNAVFNYGAIQAYASDSNAIIGVIRAEEQVRITAAIQQRPLQHRGTTHVSMVLCGSPE